MVFWGVSCGFCCYYSNILPFVVLDLWFMPLLSCFRYLVYSSIPHLYWMCLLLVGWVFVGLGLVSLYINIFFNCQEGFSSFERLRLSGLSFALLGLVWFCAWVSVWWSCALGFTAASATVFSLESQVGVGFALFGEFDLIRLSINYSQFCFGCGLLGFVLSAANGLCSRNCANINVFSWWGCWGRYLGAVVLCGFFYVGLVQLWAFSFVAYFFSSLLLNELAFISCQFALKWWVFFNWGFQQLRCLSDPHLG